MTACPKQSSPAVRAGVYTRISSDPSGQRAGVDRQRADCEAHCGARLGGCRGVLRQRRPRLRAATTVRVKDGETLTTDGPFADTKEFFGRFYLLEADNLDAAIQVASRIPAARMGGSVEIRTVVDRSS